MTITYLAIDPGEKVGIAGYDERGYLQFLEVVKAENLWAYLKQWSESVKEAVCEYYRIYSHKAEQHIQSDLATVRVIGRIEAWAEDNNIKLHMQPSSCKGTGFKYLGIKEPPRSDKYMDAKVAHAHGTYWLVQKGILDPKDLL